MGGGGPSLGCQARLVYLITFMVVPACATRPRGQISCVPCCASGQRVTPVATGARETIHDSVLDAVKSPAALRGPQRANVEVQKLVVFEENPDTNRPITSEGADCPKVSELKV